MISIERYGLPCTLGCAIEVEKEAGEKAMNSWVSSAYR